MRFTEPNFECCNLEAIFLLKFLLLKDMYLHFRGLILSNKYRVSHPAAIRRACGLL